MCNAETQEPGIHLELSSIHPDHREPPLPLRWVEFVHSLYARLFHGQRASIEIHLCVQHRASLAREVLLQRLLILLLGGVFAGLAFVASPWLFLLSGLSLGVLPFCRASNPITPYMVTADRIWLDSCGQRFLLSFPGSGQVERPDTE